jgi:hypothetical protein
MKVEIQRLPDWKHMQTGNYAWMAYVGVGYEGHVSMWERNMIYGHGLCGHKIWMGYVSTRYEQGGQNMLAQDLHSIC